MTQEQFDYLLGICDRSFARYGLVEHGRVPFEELTEVEQVFICIWSLRGQVENGGFHQYYYNAGELAMETVAALKLIGATDTAELLIKANSCFPDGAPPKNREARIKQLEQLTEGAESQLEDLDDILYQDRDKLDELMLDFVQQRNIKAM